MITVAEFKAGATLPEPIYKDEQYCIFSNAGVTIASGSLESLMNNVVVQSGYYDKCEINVRRYDLYLHSNERLPANNYQI